MNAKLFSDAMSKVNDKYYEEAAHYRCTRSRQVKFTSLAACAAIVLAVSFAAIWNRFPGQTLPQSINLNINEISAPYVVSGNINLVADDYTAMSYEELLKYFDVSLPVTKVLPYLELQSSDFGVYQSEDRNIYYDGNIVSFKNSDGTQSMDIALSKVFKHTSDVFDLSADEIKFTDINGRELAIFHYTNEDGKDCYYAEFLQGDVAFVVSSENISAEDYAECLQALVSKTQQSSNSVHTITGEVTVIDPYANHIGLCLDQEQATEYNRIYGVNLPDGQSADDYSPGERIEVTYTGEPATILTIWAEQVVNIALLP